MTIDSERSAVAARSAAAEGVDSDIWVGVHEIECAGLAFGPRIFDRKSLVGLPERVFVRRHGADEHVVHTAGPEVLYPRGRVAVLPFIAGTRVVGHPIIH